MADHVTPPRPGLFLVSRTSVYDNAKPCDGAFLVNIMQVDTRETDDPKKILAHAGTDGGWYRYGTNHRVENGKIKRDMGACAHWAIDIPDVMAFVDAHGTCVISRHESGHPNLEIYDDYRE